MVVSDGRQQQHILEDTNWSVLAKASKNGFFMFMVVLSWWANAATTAALSAVFLNFVEGVSWVLSMLLASGLFLGKHGHLNESDGVDDNKQLPKKQ